MFLFISDEQSEKEIKKAVPFKITSKRNRNNLQTINAEEGVEKREPSCTVGGNVNRYSHYGEQYGGSLKN